jgi:glyoxylase-like metal-dependent hydrolase (beta-lactamase superfamily II)
MNDMIRKHSFIVRTIFEVTFLFFLFTPGLISCKRDNDHDQTDDFIKVEKLREQAILVSMGVDAVIAIATKKGIVVIDAGISNSLTAKYRKVIEKEFKRKDFAYLINTHSHPDHIGGNQIFNDAVIIGHENCLSEISDYWKNKEKIKSGLAKIVKEYETELLSLQKGSNEWKDAFCQKARYGHAYDDLLNNHIVVSPSLTFKDTLTVSLGDATFNMIYFGKAHSGSDIIIHVPELKLFMTGDLFYAGGRLSIENENMQEVERWKKVMQWINIRLNDIDLVIGGHGQIMSQKDLEALNKFINRI